MSLIRSFLSELSKPFDLARSAATRVVSDCPRLKAAIRRTPWLASPPVCMNTAPTSGLTIAATMPLLWFVR